MPVIVGGGVRGVVTTCCYIARISGVRSAMPMFKALKLCPEAVVIKPNFPKYVAKSKRIFEKLRALTPLVQTLSLDEAWTDLGGTERLHGAPPAVTLARLQAEIEREIGLPVSIGLAANKFLAKIASDLDKPRGFAVVGGAEAEAFLAPRPVGILPGVGPAFVKSLEKRGLRTVGDLARNDPGDLAKWFGVSGARLADLSRGRDFRTVNPEGDRKSISAETTFDHDLASIADLEAKLWPLCEKIARRARIEGVAARTIGLKLRRPDFSIITRRRADPDRQDRLRRRARPVATRSRRRRLSSDRGRFQRSRAGRRGGRRFLPDARGAQPGVGAGHRRGARPVRRRRHRRGPEPLSAAPALRSTLVSKTGLPMAVSFHI